MSKLEEQYYIIFPDNSFSQKYNRISFDDKTCQRSPQFRKLTVDQEPVFFNIDSEQTSLELNKLLFSGPSIILHKSLLKNISDNNIINGQLYPSVYIDPEGESHAEYFLLNIYDEYDCWCRKRSKYRLVRDDDDDDDIEAHMFKYKFNYDRLLNIEEENRLFFKIGGVNRPRIFIHQKFLDLLIANNVEGFKAFSIFDYELGKEF